MGTSDHSPPLSGLDFAVLLALAAGPSYGYRLLRTIRERAGGGIELAPGNLYQVLDRLQARGWIEEVGPDPSEQRSGRPRRYYGLTPAGRAVTAAEADRLGALIDTARTRDLLTADGGAGGNG